MTDEEKVKEYVKEKISDMKINGFTLLEIAHLSNGANIYNPKVEHLLNDKIKEAYLAGAEFGYNKANEWHYAKDGLPQISGRYLVYTGGEPFILDFDTEVNSFGYWVVILGDDWGVRDEDFETLKDRGEDEVIAWKEIILPKEIEE